MQTGGAVVRESFDASGGFSELELSGSLLGACPGGSERVRFSWRFAEPVGSLRDGAKITADLSGAALAATGGCKGGLAARAYVSVGGSNGDVNPFTAQESATIDGGRFWPSAVGRASADSSASPWLPRTGSFSFDVDTRPHYADRPRGWFSVTVDTSAGMVRYAYLYEFGAAPP